MNGQINGQSFGNEAFMQVGCPWADQELAQLISCEERLCSWIRQPANTFSNLGLLLVGAVLISNWLRSRKRTDLDFGIISLLIGASSTFAHAAQTRFSVVFDYASQFILFAYLISFGVQRLVPLERAKRRVLTAALILVPALTQMAFKKSGMMIFGILTTLYLAMEAANFAIKKEARYGKLLVSLGVFSIAAVCFSLDASRAVCYSTNHFFQLHAWWHMLVAVSLYFMAQYYSQFTELL